VVSKLLAPGVGGWPPVQTSVRLVAELEPSPKNTTTTQQLAALDTSTTKRTGWPATGDVGSIRMRALTPFFSACQEVAGGVLGVVGMVLIGGRPVATVVVTGLAVLGVVGVAGFRVVVVTLVDGRAAGLATTAPVAVVVVSTVTVDPVGAGAAAGGPKPVVVTGRGSTTAADTTPPASSSATLARSIRTAWVAPAHPITVVSTDRPPGLRVTR
jgi:hypothetical protein